MNPPCAKGGDLREVLLTEVDPEEEDLTDGKEYWWVKTFSPGTYRYSYEAENEGNPRQTTEAMGFQVREEPVIPSPGSSIVMLAILSVSLFLRARGRGRG